MKKMVSIVVPFFNEEGNIEELANQVTRVMSASGYPYELIMVNDGSNDLTWFHMQSVVVTYPNVIALDLAGNYGQTIALRAGFEKASGEIIVAMDGDLQHDPVYIPQFLKHIENGYDMIGGSKAKRPEGKLKGFLSNTAHALICRLTGVKMQYFGATFKVFRSYLLKNSNMLGDAHRFLGALVARKGIRYMEVPIDILERNSGTSKYKWSKAFYVLLDLIFLKFIVSYIRKPFRLFGVAGLVSFLSGAGGAMFYILGSVFANFNIKENYLAEFLFSLTLIMIGAIFLSFGIIAEIGVYNYFSKNSLPPYNVRDVAFASDKNNVISVSS